MVFTCVFPLVGLVDAGESGEPDILPLDASCEILSFFSFSAQAEDDIGIFPSMRCFLMASVRRGSMG